MKSEIYPTEQQSDTIIRFFSEGPNGVLELRIIFQKDESEERFELYNLAFGVWDSFLEDIDDSVDLRNGDMDKVLATVAQTALSFLEKHPSARLFAQGSTPVRTRKYQMGITKYLPEIPVSLKILGLRPGNYSGLEPSFEKWEDFSSGTKYIAFLLCAK